MTSPYHNRLPMAYLPASRAVESVGIPPMFRSRVRGLCGILDVINPPADLGNIGTIVRQKTSTPDSTPAPTPAPTVPKPSAGLMGLPLILGAAYLLLS